jgi:hypothetical protein
LPKIPHSAGRILPGGESLAGAMMGAMNLRHAPNRCNPRAQRIAQVKFVALPLEAALEPEVFTPPPLFTTLRKLIIRVIGRLEAARP